jgi:hypothetical protein
MAKKSKAELVEEGKALNADIAAARKAAHNFALLIGPEGLHLALSRTKSADAMRQQAKKAGGGSRGAVGVMTVEGKTIKLACAEGEDPPGTLGKLFKRHLKDRGLGFKVFLAMADGRVLDDGEDGGDDDSATDEPATDIAAKLAKAHEKLKPALVTALKSAPDDHKRKLATANKAYTDAMTAEDYDAALTSLTALRKLILSTPSADRLTEALKARDDPAKLAQMQELLDNVTTRAGADSAFDKTAKPLMKDMRGALKAALAGTPTPEDKIKLEAMKTKLDQTFLAYLKAEGHGPQRHEGDVTPQQLSDRALSKKDPMTGTTRDGVHGGTHRCAKSATRFKDAGDYVDADDKLRESQGFRDKLAEAKRLRSTRFEMKPTLKSVLGDDYLSRVEGQTRQGSNRRPTGTAPTDLTDGNLIAVYKVARDGTVTLLTMYPDPK